MVCLQYLRRPREPLQGKHWLSFCTRNSTHTPSDLPGILVLLPLMFRGLFTAVHQDLILGLRFGVVAFPSGGVGLLHQSPLVGGELAEDMRSFSC